MLTAPRLATSTVTSPSATVRLESTTERPVGRGVGGDATGRDDTGDAKSGDTIAWGFGCNDDRGDKRRSRIDRDIELDKTSIGDAVGDDIRELPSGLASTAFRR